MKILPPRWRNALLPDRARFSEPIRTRTDRLAAWFDDLVIDHGLLRLAWKNRAQISPRAFRSSQPNPFDIAFAARRGIRSIVSARHDPRHGGHALEREACARLGLDFVTIPFFSREAPSRQAMLDAAKTLETLQYPVLFHCKSGADRAGFLSAFYLVTQENMPVREAMAQLSWRFGHVRASKTGILDAVFARYLDDTSEAPQSFMGWVETRYDPAALQKSFRHHFWSDLLDRVILRHE